MALSTAADYKAVVNGLLWYIDNNFSGIDRNGLPVDANIERENFNQIMTDYATYELARKARPTSYATAQTGDNVTVNAY